MPPRLGIRMPPGPPPGMPPGRLHHNNHHNKSHPMNGPVGNILSAGPQLTKDTKGMTTITAKPQIRFVFQLFFFFSPSTRSNKLSSLLLYRNLSADVTRFVPSTLRVKREDKKQHQRPKHYMPDVKQMEMMSFMSKSTAKSTTKDDAYMQFMKEMQGLL